ncbi:ribose-phosphate pyrophosphokinase [archaeon]|jgi:ribose-phosphate pyrophosphokinase|nr:ribose-phosphate pyrophosphokinase [archaeon]MBT4022512.1 ribose-phosphate pyrophosphokinase [archaeon]MBT4272351.1 ribose-phosphate pyrophosphokinase [archaeon]MBT4460460.1 ribose-phosphate pyrophosphokinase [archaeon]MBT4858479.1 ribose-phosphate pyrophosphokinase [archaeon]
MIKVFSGSAHPKFAKKVCEYLNSEVSDMTIKKFKDSEIYVKSNVPVRGDDVFLIQPTCKPTNENLMELLIMIDAMKRSSVKRINCVIPYYGYSRQDRRISAREPITAKLVANLLTKAGANRIITVDLHSPQLVGFFDIDVDHFEAYPLFAKYFKDKNLKDVVAVASDSGFVKKTRKFAKLLEAPLAIIDKRRPKHNVAEVVNVIGDIKGKTCILLDDMIDTGGTIAAGANALIQNGAKEVYIAATHGLLNGDAISKLNNCKAKEIVLTDTVPIPENKRIDKLKILSLAELMAQVIERIHGHKSLGELFSWEE